MGSMWTLVKIARPKILRVREESLDIFADGVVSTLGDRGSVTHTLVRVGGALVVKDRNHYLVLAIRHFILKLTTTRNGGLLEPSKDRG